jgi:hypothetical protein
MTKTAHNLNVLTIARRGIQVTRSTPNRSDPRASQFGSRATNFQLIDFSLNGLIKESCKSSVFAKRAWRYTFFDFLNTLLTKVVSTAAGQMGITQHQKTNRTI